MSSVRRRFLHPLWLLTSLPGYIGLRLLPPLGLGTAGTAALAIFLLAACVLIPLSVRTQAMPRGTLASGVAWLGLLAMGFLSSLFILTLARDLFLLGAHALLPGPRAASLAAPTARWALGLTAASSFIGLVIARSPRLVDVDIPLSNLPVALQGFTLAQITDLHVGPTIKRGFVERIVARVNALGADVIVVTGDLVDGSVADLARDAAPLQRLTARHGVYFVTGNHEYYSGEHAWTAQLRSLGLTVLKNQHVLLRHGGATLLLAGVTDWSAHHFDPAQRSDPAAALTGADPGALAGPKILLAHQPSSAAAAAAAGYDLQISGHTHGGHFWPWNLLVRYFQPFSRGLNRLGGLWVYVSPGTGYWGPPNRFIVRGEITRLRLVSLSAPGETV